MRYYYLSNSLFTIRVDTDASGVVTKAGYKAKPFVGQHIDDLVKWSKATYGKTYLHEMYNHAR